jgi:vacuolar-type H+-ATPase subunit H
MDIMNAIEKLEEILANARQVPFSDKVMIDREEIFEMIDHLRESVPAEIKEARWIVREKQQHLQEAEKEAQRIIAEAREKAQKLASEDEIVKEAQRQAQEIIDSAKAKEREIRMAAEDYADELFANLEANLSKLLAAVQRGRDRLQGRLTPRE